MSDSTETTNRIAINGLHQEILKARGIPVDFAIAHGIRSVDLKAVAAADERRKTKTYPGTRTPPVGALEIRYPETLDKIRRWRLRVDETTFSIPGPEGTHQADEIGECPRYLCQAGVAVAPYIPDEVMRAAGDVQREFLVVEAPLKALCLTYHGHLAIGLGGVVAGAHDRDALKELGEVVAHREIGRIEWRGRTAFIAFDAGVTSNPLVALGAARVWRALTDLGADVRIITIPYFHPQDSQPEVGVIWGAHDQGPDDYIARNGIDAFRGLIKEALPADPLARFHQIANLPQAERAVAAGRILQDLYCAAALSVASETLLSAIVALKVGLTKTGLRAVVSEFQDRIAARASKEKPEWTQGFRRTTAGVIRPIRENVELALSNDPQLKGLLGFDVFSQTIAKLGTPPWAAVAGPWTDLDDIRLATYLADTHEIVDVHPPKIRAAVIAVSHAREFHPIQDYLGDLKWDGVPRVDSWLTNFLGVEPSDYSMLAGRWWLVSAVARAFQPGCQADHVLVLEGKQGIGKSTALRILGGQYFSEADLGDLRSKDAALTLQGSWIHEFGEGDILSRASFRALKAFITNLSDDVVMKYSNLRTSLPRRCVFALTINEASDYLGDDENRRFLPVHCQKVDAEALTAARDQLWAEAVRLYRGGEAWHPTTAAERDLCRQQQTERQAVDPWEHAAKRAVAQLDTVTVSSLLLDMKVPVDRQARADSLRAARVLRAIGWVETGGRKEGRRWMRGPSAEPKAEPEVSDAELEAAARLVQHWKDEDFSANLIANT